MAEKAEVEFTYSGENVIELLNKAQETGNNFHILLLDLNMPRIGGKEILEIIKADKAYDELKVFVFTNSDSSEDMDECRRLGADAFFQKPYDFKRLLDFFTSLNEAMEFCHCISIPLVNSRYAELNNAA